MNPLIRTSPLGDPDPLAVPRIDPDLIRQYEEAGWWGNQSIAQILRDRAANEPDRIAFGDGERYWTWSDYDRLTDEIATTLIGLGLDVDHRVGVFLPDGFAIHAALAGCSRAGVVAVGIGARAGDAELDHLLRGTQARVLITQASHRGRDASTMVEMLKERGVAFEHLVVLGVDDVAEVRWIGDGPAPSVPTSAGSVTQGDLRARGYGPNEVSMVNSTSGTTGLPKCVTQFDNRWIYFSRLAVEAGVLTQDDVILAAVPTPFGFGLWTSHFIGMVLGARTIVMPRFTAEDMIRLIQSERVTVLCCVATQFRMLLNSPLADKVDLSSLRVMFTGGEAIPVQRAIEFEERTGATLLQFFGSNESGAFSYTTLQDPREKRLTTGGRLIPNMQVRIFDEVGCDITGPGAVGQPGGRGPLTCVGYYGDQAANEQLFTDDGWLLMGDLVRLDEDNYLTLVGRTSDIIIRGGKNISVAEVEAVVETHPSVELVSVVAVPDAVFGERVCAVVSLRPGTELSLNALTGYLDELGVSREWFPEHLLIVPELPRNSGGKIAKGEVRAYAERFVVGVTR